MKTMTAFGLLALSAMPLHAVDFNAAVNDYVTNTLSGWADDAELITALNARNAETAALTEDDIAALDQAWKDELGAATQPKVDAVVAAPYAEVLRGYLAASDGYVTEVFVTDARGLNVFAAAPTSDYWQGDEAKFQETFPKGVGTVFIDEVEMDESTQTYQVQVSFTISDPASGTPIGVMTVGMNAEKF